MLGVRRMRRRVGANKRMRRLAMVTTILLAATALGTGGSASASVARAQSKTHFDRINDGSVWTIKAGATCENDSFAKHHAFSDVVTVGSGDHGRDKGKNNLTMTWTGGPASGHVFAGTWSRATGEYTGTYSHGTHSVAATLVPFSAGGCSTAVTPTFHTQVQRSTIVPGTSDTAIAIAIGVGRVSPTGTVHFYVCSGDAAPCTETSPTVVDLGSIVLVGSGGGATATTAAVTPTATGSYCFLGVYSGDSSYASVSDGSTLNECFTVAMADPGVTTKPANATIVIGASDTDNATVIGADGVTPTGSVHFYECAGSSTPCTAFNAANGGSDLGTAALSGSAGIATASSAAFTAPATGSYCFLGVYSGDSIYYPASDGSTSYECFTVTIGTAQLTTQPDPALFTVGLATVDTAYLTGAYGLTPTGTVTFYVCGPEETSTAVACTDAGTDLGAVTLSGSGDAATATSASFTPSVVGLYCFLGVYSGDSHYSPASDGSTFDECFQVEPVEPPHPS